MQVFKKNSGFPTVPARMSASQNESLLPTFSLTIQSAILNCVTSMQNLNKKESLKITTLAGYTYMYTGLKKNLE